MTPGLRLVEDIYSIALVQAHSVVDFGYAKICRKHFLVLEFRGGKPPLILVARVARTNVADYVR